MNNFSLPEATQEEPLPSLWDYLLKVADFRKNQGKRYQLASILVLGIVATLCGYKSYGAMAEWGENYGAELAKKLGMKNSLPDTFCHSFRVGKTYS